MEADRPLLMIPGPIEFSPAVLKATGEPSLSHVSPDFINLFSEALILLRQVFLTTKAQPFVVSGSGTLGWDMVGANLLERDEKALVVSTGYFGDRFADCLESFGAQVTKLKAATLGDCPSVEELKQALSQASYKLVTLTHVDTSTGVLTDVKSFAKAIREVSPQTLVVVDGVCATGAEEFRMDEWDVDVCHTASQKAIGVPPGLAILLASPRAMEVFANRKTRPAGYFIDWNRWLPIMQNYEAKKGSYFATPAVNLVKALNVSLKEILADGGMEKRFQAHVDASRKVREAIRAFGLEFIPVREELFAHTLTVVRLPAAVTDGAKFLGSVKQHGAVLAGGLFPEIKYFRIGHMAYSVVSEAEHGHVLRTLKAIEAGLRDCGYAVPEGAALPNKL